MRISIMTLFPEMCERVMEESIIGRARRAGKLQADCWQIRDYTLDKFGRVDDTPYGGGMGMLLQADPIYRCYEAVCQTAEKRPHVIFMSPQGKTLTQDRAFQLSRKEHLLLVCGHYEGVDQRVLDEIVDEELSIGDYVLTGGELAALVVADCVGRLCPGVLSDHTCFTEESHWNGLLEYPQYTRPAQWHDQGIPEVLLSGHHKNIEAWRHQRALENTWRKRPEMLEHANLSEADLKFLKELEQGEQICSQEDSSNEENLA